MYKLLSAIVLGCCFIAIEGVPVEQLKIIGGHNVTIEQYPYQVSIQINDKHWCAGAIISPKHIITNGLCLTRYSDKPELFSVRVGSSYLNRGGKVYKVANLFLQQDYVITTGIVELKEALVFGAGIQKIALASPDYVIKDGVKAVVTGWGSSDNDGPLADQLQAVEVTTLSRESCKAYYDVIASDDYCATYQQDGKDAACGGDDGGPLVASNALIGFIRLAPGCGQPNQPGKYTNVASLRKFIDPIVNA